MFIESISFGLLSGAACYSQFKQPLYINPYSEIGLLCLILACLYIVYLKKAKLGQWLYFFTALLAVDTHSSCFPHA
jgi:hypothetical protein